MTSKDQQTLNYLPEQVKKLYDEVAGPFADELRRLGALLADLRADVERVLAPH